MRSADLAQARGPRARRRANPPSTWSTRSLLGACDVKRRADPVRPGLGLAGARIVSDDQLPGERARAMDRADVLLALGHMRDAPSFDVPVDLAPLLDLRLHEHPAG